MANNEQGLSGLANLGNTCYINSCLQVLSHTCELSNFLDKETYKNKLNNKCDSVLLIEWDNLRKLMWQENKTIFPNKFVQVLHKISSLKGNELFNGYAQNDISEFLLFIIDCFHNSLSREVIMTIEGQVENSTDEIAFNCYEIIKKMYTKDYSEIWNIFYGIQVSQLSSLETNKSIKNIPEPYFILDLPIPTNIISPTLYDCFDLYCEGEILNGENGLKMENGQVENIIKKINFWSLPTILVIDLKRFKSSKLKNQNLITYPIEDFNLSKYVIGYKKESYIYDLYAICNHSGGLMGGHYTSFVKTQNSQWYHFNDTIVSKVEKIGNLISPKAYCLFYRKKSL
jgi:ubiquitin carboxyl-terminal hydrolase 8